MKNEYECIEDVIEALGVGGLETCGDIVDALVELGNTDKVYYYHDAHLGLKIDLPDEFLSAPVDGLDEKKFEHEIEEVLDNARKIIFLSKRELSEDDIDDIKEDISYRGGDPDDFSQ